MSRFFILRENIHGARAAVTGEELAHMRRVLRLKPGDRSILFDSAGWEHEGVISAYSAAEAEVEILRSYRPERESPLAVVLAQALGKGEKMDLVIEKATELGVKAIIPFVCARSVPRLGERKAEDRRVRWKKIALSAVKQSGRTVIPEIAVLKDFSAVISDTESCEIKLLFWEQGRSGSLGSLMREHPQIASACLLIGPEGGFTPEEADQAEGCGFIKVSLGKRILRTETAAVAAVAIVQHLWGDLG